MRNRVTKIKYLERIKFLTKMLILGISIGSLWWFYHYLFVIVKINCLTQQQQTCPTPVTTELDLNRGRNLLFLDTDQLEEKITASSVAHLNFEIVPALPGTLNARLEIADELAQISVSTTSANLVVLENYGIVTLGESSSALPVLDVEQAPPLEIGQVVDDERLLGALRLLKVLKSELLGFRRYTVATDSARIVLKNDQIALFDTTSDLDRQLRVLQIIMNEELDPAPIEIDVRFEKPIIRYIQPSGL